MGFLAVGNGSFALSAVINIYARGPGKALVAVGFPVAPAYGLEDFDAGIRDQRVHTLEVAAAFTGVELARHPFHRKVPRCPRRSARIRHPPRRRSGTAHRNYCSKGMSVAEGNE